MKAIFKLSNWLLNSCIHWQRNLGLKRNRDDKKRKRYKFLYTNAKKIINLKMKPRKTWVLFGK